MDDFESKFQREFIHKYINTTNNHNEKIILTLRLEGRTLADIGQQIGVSHERVRQVLDKCFKKLKRMYA
jgi:RNA polymerase sigma factor (sigma-70 family)